MKSLLLTTLLFIGFSVSAQNYRLIPSGVNCYINKDGYIRAIRLDSGALYGNDSLFHSGLYVQGLGFLTTMVAYNNHADFTYYKKGTEEWGTYFTGINEINANTFSVSVSPNPANDKVTFQLTETHSPTNISILDLAGRELLSTETVGEESIALNTSTMKDGLYLYHVKCGEKIANGKLVIGR